MHNLAKYYTPNTLSLVDQFTGSADQAIQQDAIEAIVASNERSKARLLVSLLNYSMWRENTILLIRAIGETNEQRGVEFLIRFVRRLEDLPLAAEAVLALGRSHSQLAGEFLLSIVNDKSHCLRREAVVGLAALPHIPCDLALINIINESDANPNLQISAIVAMGRRCSKIALPIIFEKMKSKNESVFHACLLAVGHLANSDNFQDIISQVDARSNLFLSELSLYAEDKIHLRAQQHIEDIILAMLASDQRGWNTHFRLIKEYPHGKVWPVVNLLRDQVNPNSECLIRAAIFRQHRSEEHLSFLLEHYRQIDIEFAANLLRLCLNATNQDLFLSFERHYAYELLKRVAVDDLLSFQQSFYTDEEDSNKLRFIDALIAQNFMTARANEIHSDWLYQEFKATTNKVLASRIMRGLAQLCYTKDHYIQDLREALNDQENSSVFYCLGLIPKSVSEQVLTERLERSIQHHDEHEIANGLLRLARLCKLKNPAVIAKLKGLDITQWEMDLLKILVHNKVPGFESLIAKSIQGGHAAKQLLAVSAVASNNTKDLSEKLFPFLNSTSSQLRERALHSLCVRGTARQHAALLTWFSEHSFNRATAIKIVRTLTPRETESYLLVATHLRQLIETPSGPFLDAQLLHEWISLYDTLLIHYCKDAAAEQQRPIEIHKQDEQLGRDIHCFNHYSETLRTILRNAELTWQHKELFDDNVDKSTMLVQYTKSADLLLQQRIGEKIFHQTDDALLLAMQSRIMALNIEDKNLTTHQLMKRLGVENHFSTAEFPTHKLIALARSVMTGKFMQERYRMIDGLRAWALVLLLFGRHFSSDGTTYSPILDIASLKTAAAEKINQVAALMNYLQELRNRAAHHGVFVEYSQMATLRQDCINLFNDLDDILSTD